MSDMKKLMIALLAIAMTIAFVGCRQANKVSYNLSQEADNFNVVRQITVINCRTDDIMFQMTGKLSLQNEDEGELAVIVEDENGVYHKHFIYLNAWVTYVVEDLGGADVSNYHYTLNYNPKMWRPFDEDVID
jgi:uncharacterized protein YjaZ